MKRLISVFLAGLTLQLLLVSLMADASDGQGHHYLKAEAKKEHRVHGEHRERKREGEKGNEATGQVAAWLFVLANSKVAISISTRFATRLFGSESRFMSSMVGLSRFLKKRLRKVHYLLNPAALIIAFIHFRLSSCRSTSIPEWGLLFAASMVLLGLALKLAPFMWVRKAAYPIHTGSAAFLVVLIVLAGGHLMID